MARDFGVTYRTIRNAEKAARQALGAPERLPHSQWKIPASEWPALLKRIDQGASLSQIAREYGVSRKAVQRVEKAARQALSAPQRPPRYRHIPRTEWPIIVNRIDQGETFSQIAKDYGTSETSVRRLEKEARQALNMPRPLYIHWKIARSEWPAVLQRKEQGESLREIASSYGVSKATIRRTVKAAQKQGGEA